MSGLPAEERVPGKVRRRGSQKWTSANSFGTCTQGCLVRKNGHTLPFLREAIALLE